MFEPVQQLLDSRHADDNIIIMLLFGNVIGEKASPVINSAPVVATARGDRN
jgi:hypothetical protein